jgi:ribonuclease P protein component
MMDVSKRFSLSAKERIKSKKDFEQLFSSGQTIYSSDKRIKAIYLTEKNSQTDGVKIAAVVSKKAGKAVWRNRVKRLIKEVYRLNKENLSIICSEKKIKLKIILAANQVNELNQRKIKLNDLMPGILEVLDKIKNKLK